MSPLYTLECRKSFPVKSLLLLVCKISPLAPLILGSFIIFGASLQKVEGEGLSPDAQEEKPWRVVVSADAPTMTRFAGKELASLLSEGLGREVPIRAGTDNLQKGDIALGDHPHLKEQGIDTATLPRDGFIIRTHGDHLHIAGRDGNPGDVEKIMTTGQWHRRNSFPERGTLYGVYEFLERYAEVRFYFPGRYGTIVPRLTHWQVPEINLQVAPAHKDRFMGFTGELFPEFDEGYPGKSTDEKGWYFKTLDKLRLRQQTGYVPQGHGLANYGYLERFGTNNPEYFAMMANGKRHNDRQRSHPGHLCFSSNIREEIYQDAKAYLTGQDAASRKVRPRPGGANYIWPTAYTQPGYFNIMPQDGFYPCNCEECQVHFQGTSYSTLNRESTSKFIWDFFIDLAERLTREGVPGKLATMAYPPYNHLPKRKIPENLDVSFCPPGADAVRDLPVVTESLRAWYEKTEKTPVQLWINVGKYGDMKMPGIPFVIPRAMGHYLKTISPYISGAYVSLPQDVYLFKYINAYVANKVLWDPSVDVDKLLAEHYRLMFGPAAETMESVYERFEDHWTQRIRGATVETDLGDTAVPPSEYALWNEIYSSEEMNRLNALFDRAEQEAADDSGALERVRFMRRNLFAPLEKAREAHVQIADQVRHLQCFAPKIDEGSAPTLDGTTDEPIWKQAEPLHLHRYGNERPPSVETIVRLLRDDRHLYLSFQCEEPNIAAMVAEVREADSTMLHRESSIEVFLNPSGDRKEYFQIAVNPLGTIVDASGTKLGQDQALDRQWDSKTVYKTKIGENGWTVEMAIPMEKLGKLNPKGFPVNFSRSRVVRGEATETYSWSPYLKHGFHDLGNFGTLHFSDARPINLIRNGHFSASPGSGKIPEWRGSRKGEEGGDWVVTGDHFIDTGRALQLTGPGKGGSISLRQDLPGLLPNTEYEISFYVRVENVQPAGPSDVSSNGARVSIWEGRNRYFPSTPLIGTLDWQRMGFRLRTGPETNLKAKSYLALILREATGTVWFDGVRVAPVAEKEALPH